MSSNESEPLRKEQVYSDGVLDVEAPSPIILFFVLWTVLYGYFALRMDRDPEDCWATPDSDFIQPGPSETGENVGELFRHCYEGFLFLTLFQLKIAVLSYCIRSEVCRQFLFLFILLSSYAFIGLWIFLIYVRFSQTGKVCSGDYLT